MVSRDGFRDVLSGRRPGKVFPCLNEVHRSLRNINSACTGFLALRKLGKFDEGDWSELSGNYQGLRRRLLKTDLLKGCTDRVQLRAAPVQSLCRLCTASGDPGIKLVQYRVSTAQMQSPASRGGHEALQRFRRSVGFNGAPQVPFLLPCGAPVIEGGMDSIQYLE